MMRAEPLYDTAIGRDRLVHEIPRAVLVIRAKSRSGQPLGLDAEKVWLPKSHTRWMQAAGRAVDTLHAPMWLCGEKGL